MLRRLLIAALGALLFAVPAHAQGKVTLMPGVTYEAGVQFTTHGPVAFHVLTAPRPGGLYAVKPTLAKDTILGKETVTSMQKRLSSTATVAGVNGDLFNWNDGHPSGVMMRDGVLDHPPLGERSSIGIDDAGALHVDRVKFFGTWRGTGQRRTLNGINETPRGRAGRALHAGVGAGDSGDSRRRRGDDLAAAAVDPEHGSRRPRDGGDAERRHADPGRRRGARGARRRGRAEARRPRRRSGRR